MRKLSKIFLLSILPIITLVLFIIIGRIQTYHEYFDITTATHHVFSSDTYMNIWIGRGIYSMLLVLAISFVLFSKRTNIKKIITFFLLILLNAPVISFIYLLITFPLFILIIPILNLLAFTPFYIKAKPNLS